jgi:pyruvate/2-oxoglutarate dehydrogenase complex dihydrolipoamide acyltransferase (E2) component
MFKKLFAFLGKAVANALKDPPEVKQAVIDAAKDEAQKAAAAAVAKILAKGKR